jgi:hypothetical protein
MAQEVGRQALIDRSNCREKPATRVSNPTDQCWRDARLHSSAARHIG